MRRLNLSGNVVTLVLMCVALALAGCSNSDPDPITSIPQVSSFTSAQDEYQLQHGDNLKVVVLGQEAISGDYAIDGQGAIDVSNVGLMPVAGMTVREVEARLTEKLRNGIVESPRVSVLLDAKRPVFVSGAVANPGEYSFRAGMDVRSAIAAAGGYTGNASQSVVYITKAGTSVEAAHVLDTNPVVGPGDTLRIPPSS